MKAAVKAVAVLAAMLVAGCNSGGVGPRGELSSQPSIGITQAVWDAYNNKYLATHTPLAFAVSENGQTFYYFYCEAIRCINLNSNEAITDAIARCQGRGQGTCVLFAAERSEPRKHHLIDTLGQRLKSP